MSRKTKSNSRKQGRGEATKELYRPETPKLDFVLEMNHEYRRFFRSLWEFLETDRAPRSIKMNCLMMHHQMYMNDLINDVTK